MIVVFGGDALVLRVCEQLIERDGARVTVLWDDAGFRIPVERCGATFVARGTDERASLAEAGILEATALLAIADDDHANLQCALAARDLNPGVRLVLRQFNRTLARKIEQNLSDCSVVSLSSHSAATYASAAVDPACYFGVQFPDIDGPLVGFFERSGSDPELAGLSPDQIEERTNARVVARDGELAFDRGAALAERERVITFGRVSARFSIPSRSAAARRRTFVRRVRRAVRHADPLVRGLLLAFVAVLVAGTAYFAKVLGLDVPSAAYFVVATMTTTGYGDISPRTPDGAGQAGAIVLMLAGVVLTGILVAVGSSLFTRAQYARLQGLRRINRRGHVVVCGAGNVGSRVIDFLVRLRCRVVVVEVAPKPEAVEGSRAGRFDLLTGDATKDATLDLCNLGEAAALVALTNSDSTNLEVALGARARNAALPIVMRVQHETFESSVRRHFGIDRTYGTAALAAPMFVGLAAAPGTRGRVRIGARDFRVVERDGGLHPADAAGFVPLCVARDGDVAFVRSPLDARPGERLLWLEPLPQAPPDGAGRRTVEAGRS